MNKEKRKKINNLKKIGLINVDIQILELIIIDQPIWYIAYLTRKRSTFMEIIGLLD